MRDQVGHMLGEGMIEGLEDEKAGVQAAFDDMMPDIGDMNLNVKASSSKARAAIAAPASVPSYSGSVITYELSDNALRRLSDSLVAALDRAGIGEAVIKLNEREFGRTIRRGLEVGFV
jgi:hypothetical protein